MNAIRDIREMSIIADRLKRQGRKMGFVPTMGYLHNGHLSLIRKARRESDIVIVSIFVNPLQFGPKEDYKQYPRDLKHDKRLAEKAGCDIVFYPSAEQMYPEGHKTSLLVVRDLTDVMCGISRPGHFEGVATVCAKLFNIIKPDNVYFGQKDYQQVLIIRRMVKDLNMGFSVKMVPTIREKDCLAMSSRNLYLTPRQRRNAAVLYQGLKEAKRLIMLGEKDADKVKLAIWQMIKKVPETKIDYITIAAPQTLQEKTKIDSKVLIALAVWFGKTRLIDNILV